MLRFSLHLYFLHIVYISLNIVQSLVYNAKIDPKIHIKSKRHYLEWEIVHNVQFQQEIVIRYVAGHYWIVIREGDKEKKRESSVIRIAMWLILYT